MFEVRMPQKGLTETSAYLSKWYVGEGDRVKAGDYLFAMETSKSVFDVESETEGTVIAVLFPEGEEVDVETVVCVIGNEGESYEGPAADAVPAQEMIEEPASSQDKTVSYAGPAAFPLEPEVCEADTLREADGAKDGGKTAISPRAKAKAEELGIGYDGILPTGPEGRIIEEDILAQALRHLSAECDRRRSVRAWHRRGPLQAAQS